MKHDWQKIDYNPLVQFMSHGFFLQDWEFQCLKKIRSSVNGFYCPVCKKWTFNKDGAAPSPSGCVASQQIDEELIWTYDINSALIMLKGFVESRARSASLDLSAHILKYKRPCKGGSGAAEFLKVKFVVSTLDFTPDTSQGPGIRVSYDGLEAVIRRDPSKAWCIQMDGFPDTVPLNEDSFIDLICQLMLGKPRVNSAVSAVQVNGGDRSEQG